MKKLNRNIILGLPILLFIVSSNLGFAKASSGLVIQDSKYVFEQLSVGTVFSGLFTTLLVAMVAVVLINSFTNQVASIGKALYALAMINIYNVFVIMSELYSVGGENSINALSFGGILMLVAAILGIVISVFFLFKPLVIKLASGGNFEEKELQEKDNPIELIKEWKELLDEEIITEDEFVKLKTDLMSPKIPEIQESK